MHGSKFMQETNSIIKKEYRELVNLLNTGNKSQNQKTEIYFFIKSSGREAQLFAGVNERQKLLLCISSPNYWVVALNTQFINLANFICELLKDKMSFESQELSKLIRDSVFFIEGLS